MIPILWALALSGSHGALAAESSPAIVSAVPSVAPLDALVRKALANGAPNRIPGPIAEPLGVPPDAPVQNLEVSAEQTTDALNHDFKVMVEVVKESIKPLGLVLASTARSPGKMDRYLFRASLDGKLAKAVAYHGKLDDQNRTIKGSGSMTEEDVSSRETKKRYKHELDLWLKRAYIKKEWRTAEFAGGTLKKAAEGQ